MIHQNSNQGGIGTVAGNVTISIKQCWLKLAILMLAMVLYGCYAHSPFIILNTTDVSGQSLPAKRQPHTRKILFLVSSLPPHLKHKVIGQIDAGRVWYGNDESVLDQIAEKARALGADAVVEVSIWRQPSGFSWASPHASGTAVLILDRESIDFSTLGGQWR